MHHTAIVEKKLMIFIQSFGGKILFQQLFITISVDFPCPVFLFEAHLAGFLHFSLAILIGDQKIKGIEKFKGIFFGILIGFKGNGTEGNGAL